MAAIQRTQSQSRSPPCSLAYYGCNLSHLLKRAIDLIDPSQTSTTGDDSRTSSSGNADEDKGDTVVSATDPTIHVPAETNGMDTKSLPTTTTNTTPDNGTESSSSQPPKKKVRFNKSCAPARKSISANDAIQAYDILIHAASIISSSPSPSSMDDVDDGTHDGTTIDVNAATTSWETLQHVADIYRALLVTSCLLMELLPSPPLPEDVLDKDDTTGTPEKSLIRTNQSTSSIRQSSATSTCPPISVNDPSSCIPALSSAIEKRIRSTSRRCILLLQALERLCAAKAIAQRHTDSSHVQSVGNNNKTTSTNRNGNNNNSLLLPTSSFYSGGDDIHDYDRNTTDLHSNYDWHDDGHLPLPSFSSFNENNNNDDDNKTINPDPKQVNTINLHGSSSSSSHKTNHHQSNNKSSSNILHECCYRPVQSTDPPSSKFEKNAYTRDWIRGERIVSLRLDDYHHHEEDESSDVVEEYECEGGFGGIGTETINSETKTCNLDGEPNDEVDSSEVRDDQDNDDGDDNDENVIFNFSPKALAEEEDCLLDIMLPSQTTASSDHPQSTTTTDGETNVVPAESSSKCSSKKHNARERRRRKRQRKKSPVQNLAKLDPTSSDGTASQLDQSVHVKEGFLILVCEDYPNTIVNYPGTTRDKSNTHASNNNNATKRIRVYARLHLSGLLSIEDCSIRRRRESSSHSNNEVITDQQQQEPLTPRVRYWNFFIQPKTRCQPCMPEGANSNFHFRLDCVSLLGASSLYRETMDNINNASLKNENDDLNASNDDAVDNLLFSVDEETGGAFVDGFEWVNVFTGAANSACLLQDTIHSS